ncbi:TonB-dependent receptor plug domain-containing protein [Hyphococcus sp. DH-69]|uniref:TonB-dependent receptor plug domain-containing protein n=1 Tax=Hyphococcus formosus TaxID=3143534 RepID=UPI00398BB2DC
MASQLIKNVLRIGTSSAALLLGAAQAQHEQFAAAEEDEITVTASRIRTDGFMAPTPVTVLGENQIKARGTTNIANIINESPAFTGSATSTSTVLNSRLNGVNAVDLRGLGVNRNLVLVNGRRVPAFNEFGNVDLNAFPSLAVKRVEVVTGGASAAWGSDAVSGVVNLIYDDTLEGAKLNVQYGASLKGDASDLKLAAAWGGRFSDDRGHVLVAFDYNDNGGVSESKRRDWALQRPGLLQNPADTGPNDGIPQYIIRDNTRLFLASPNGVTLPGSSPVSNLEFSPGGAYGPRALGQIGGNLMVGGSGSTLGDHVALAVPVERYNGTITGNFEVSQQLQLFVEAGYAHTESRGPLIDAFAFGVPIQPDNPYLPADIAALNTPFALFRTFNEIPTITSVSKNEMMRFVTGARGDFNDRWRWETSIQYGETHFSNDQPSNLIPANLYRAADSVFDPSVGEIVCRANANGAEGAPGCVPINLFGQGSPNSESLDYITADGISDTKVTQFSVGGFVEGELIQGWAGPVMTSMGLEHRRETLNRTVNDLNDNEAFLIVNAQPLDGKINVTEVFGELAVPLISGKQALDINLAGRYTDYNTVGGIVTWKAGLNYSPVEPIRFRATVSSDIRAPNIGENFLDTLLVFADVDNPFTGNRDFIAAPRTGNTGLAEERALTTTAGVVYSSDWGFSASLDWYLIDLEDAIGEVSTQSIVDQCFEADQSFCDLITFDSDQTILEVLNRSLNLGVFKVEGLDFELNYVREIGPGALNLRALGSYLIRKEISPDGENITDVAGELGAQTFFGTPDFRSNISISYDTDKWGLFSQVRYISDGVFDANFGPEQLAPEENNIGAVAYWDVSVRYKVVAGESVSIEAYAGVDNVLNRNPPVVPRDFIANIATNPTHYDVIGRKVFVGLRAEF